jgi:hypothetical protein
VEVSDYGYRAVPVYGRYGGYRGSIGYRDVEVQNTIERTLAIEAFDTKTKEVVWVGWSKTESSAPVKVEKLQKMIRSILAEFPAGSPLPAAPKN